MTDLVWVSALPEGLAKAKGVLLCYCQHYNDRRGISNPGVPRVARMCGISERTAQKHIRDLERARILLPRQQRTGLTTCYTIDISSLQPLFPLIAPVDNFPSNALTPAESSALPPQFSASTPAETAPKQSLTINTTDRTAAPTSPVQPYPFFEGVNPETLADFAACRKDKYGRGAKGKVTEALIAKIAEQATLAGMTVQAALEYCCHAERRWASFNAGWLKPKASAPAAATPVKVWEPDTTPIPPAAPAIQPPPPAKSDLPEVAASALVACRAKLSPAFAAKPTPAAAPAMPTGASDIRIAADAPQWAVDIVTKQRTGQAVSRNSLHTACAVLKLDPAMLRTGVSVPARASAPVSVSVSVTVH